MFIANFSVENWVGNQNQEILKPAQNWAEIQVAIEALDGDRNTLVTLETESEAHMAIGGGAGKYIVYATFDNKNFRYLVDRSQTPTTETVVVGGQEGTYSAQQCVDLPTTLKAAQSFAESGKIEASVVWEQDSVFEPA